jgi:hypothetical protein
MFNILLLEDNNNVESLIQYLDSLIVTIRKSGKLNNEPELLKYIQDFYKTYPMFFYENYVIKNIEMDSKLEQEIINEILDFINILNSI